VSRAKRERPLLLVLKGFSREFLGSTGIEKLTSLPVGISLEQLHEGKQSALREIVNRFGNNSDQVFWTTYEEYEVIGDQVVSAFCDILILNNNVYDRTYPCLYPVADMDDLYETHFAEEDVEVVDEHPSFDRFSQVYGSLKRIANRYYITYADSSDGIGFYPVTRDEVRIRPIPDGAEAVIELSEDESEFLSLTDRLLSGDHRPKEVEIAFSGDLDAFGGHYIERISVLQQLVGASTSIFLVTKPIRSSDGGDQPQYLDILDRYWSYKSFRMVRFYRDVNNPERKKETVTISQGQIIADIVREAEKCLSGKDFRDVFVTAPTGSGKSLMFQIPAIYLAEKHNLMTIVISPLIGLMTDQIEGLHNRRVHFAATINSEVTPAQKADIINRIREGSISILYISPETLLSRSDISQLIGSRQVGLLVVDEAHIVTTWGKAFRADYWYLGAYLQKLRRSMQFPVAAFTATAIYGGIEDMYAETRDSLNLVSPIAYFGYVKRDNIDMQIRRSSTKKRFAEYLYDKFKVLLFRLQEFVRQGYKTLVYFPTIRLILDFKRYLQDYAPEDFGKTVCCYYGSLDKTEKGDSFRKFRSGESKVMLATKAFGMGIDIPDIGVVYHFAPTGNVCDYVQEIGRAARQLDRGYAYFDFLPQDFVHVKRLHGISTLRKHQLIQVMDKVLKVAKASRSGFRNLLINSDEFRYIFERRVLQDQSDDVDNKLKTALLIIEKDFRAKLGYSPIIARPQSMFAREYIMVQKDKQRELEQSYGRYMRRIRDLQTGEDNIYGPVYVIDMKLLWEHRYQSLSFPQFKFKFHSDSEPLDADLVRYTQPVLQVIIELRTANRRSFDSHWRALLDAIGRAFGHYSRTRRHFSTEDFASQLRSSTGLGEYAATNLATVVLSSAENYQQVRRQRSNFYRPFMRYLEQEDKYDLQNGEYDGFLTWVDSHKGRLFSAPSVEDTEKRLEVFLSKVRKERVDELFMVLGLMEAMDLAFYEVHGGDNPGIYVRINTRLPLERAVADPARYENWILTNVYERHRTSVEMLTYLFENEVSTEEFWDLIEDYFLGTMPDEVQRRLSRQQRGRAVPGELAGARQ
jgi:ATP-dependent DNA helicase RecQ